MKKILFFITTIILSLGFISCSDEDPDGEEIFPTTPVAHDAFEEWLLNNFTYPYNVEVKYKYDDKYTNMSYNLVPADSAHSAKLMKIVKFLWFDAYAEVMGPSFVKENVPRVINLIGSPAFNVGQGTMILGSAEGGYVITLYMVNRLDDDVLENYYAMNEYYFHTMHHEFTHILTQKKDYDENFQLITDSSYVKGDWYRKQDFEAYEAGFVSTYAMSESNEDFAETMSTYITSSDEDWADILDIAGDRGAALINRKLSIVRSYMKEEWGLDIDKMRSCVLRRANELPSLDLNTLE